MSWRATAAWSGITNSVDRNRVRHRGTHRYDRACAGRRPDVHARAPEILPYAKPVEFTLGAQTWLLDDQHCVRANCSCQEAALSFFELRPSAQHSGIASEPTLCIRYAYDTGQIEPLSGAKDGRWSGRDFVDALREVLPDLDPVLAKRQALLRRLYRRALSRKTIRLQAPKPGRNDPCPCGSGKKYKKCCGA
jgi:hypothetical protein